MTHGPSTVLRRLQCSLFGRADETGSSLCVAVSTASSFQGTSIICWGKPSLQSVTWYLLGTGRGDEATNLPGRLCRPLDTRKSWSSTRLVDLHSIYMVHNDDQDGPRPEKCLRFDATKVPWTLLSRCLVYFLLVQSHAEFVDFLMLKPRWHSPLFEPGAVQAVDTNFTYFCVGTFVSGLFLSDPAGRPTGFRSVQYDRETEIYAQ